MIRLPPTLVPSELLCLDALSTFTEELLAGSRSHRASRACADAERCASDALEASQEAGAQVSRAAALVHLCDVHRAMGRLGTAAREARRAHQLFATQPSRYQRHNEAIAAYALGLAHHSLGNRTDALRWYNQADRLLEKVIVDWAAVDARSQVARCTRTREWLQVLIEALTRADMRAPADCTPTVWLPVVPADDESGFSLAQLAVKRYVVAGTLNVGGRAFDVEVLQGQSELSLQADADYYALRVPTHALAMLGAREGDFALIARRRDASDEGPGVLETLSGAEFGRFKRNRGGTIHFVRPDATVIGAKQIGEDLPVGYVRALLKPKSD